MVRWLVIAGVAAIAFTIYALVDVAMTQAPRIRAFPKAVWIALIVVLPVIGPVLWLLIGKSKPSRSKPTNTRRAPDDDPSFLGTIDGESSDERIVQECRCSERQFRQSNWWRGNLDRSI